MKTLTRILMAKVINILNNIAENILNIQDEKKMSQVKER